MKRYFFVLIALLCAGLLAGQSGENNDFYDNTPTYQLPQPTIEVTGEIENPGPVDLTTLPLRSIIVREAVHQKDTVAFVGSYRYDGYSLFDILKERIVNKRNKKDFSSVIDLLVQVENDQGEKVVLSWGELFYPNTHHRILVAVRVSPIIPTLTKEEWPLPQTGKLICGNDLITERNIEKPCRIKVFTPDTVITGKKGSSPSHSPSIAIRMPDHKEHTLNQVDRELATVQYATVFYGRGKGFHGIQHFQGRLLREVLSAHIDPTALYLRRGYLVVSSVDGYRITLSFSELFNRNDQSEFLLTDSGKGEAKGRFRIFPAADFFSDRAIYAINHIYIRTI